MPTPAVIELEVIPAVAYVAPESPAVDLTKAESRVIVAAGAGGPPGPPGAAGAVYTHTQSSPAATWTITHTLGRKPAAVTVWQSDELVYTDVDAPDTTTVVITFPSPMTGRVELA